ncbi:MAG TPA: SBBP repeat-containing protein, partial [Crinalium sp.]
ATDSAGNPYIAGEISGTAENKGSQGFFAKYNSDGSQLFQQQIGTNVDDEAYAIALDGTSNVYVAGQTLGSLSGTNAGQYDVFAAKYPPVV